MRIIDLHHHREPPPGTIYCGRAMPYRTVPEIAHAGAPLANPFTARKHGARALPLFREHLNRLIERRDGAVLAALAAITEASALACWCVDLEGEAIFPAPETC